VNEKGCSAKATETEAGQRPVPPRSTPAQRPCSFHPQGTSDGLVYFSDTPVLRGNKKAAARIDQIDPESVTAIRTKLHLSQTEFSAAFGISPTTLRNWEQGRRQPTGAARVLLRVAAKHPKAVLEAVR
jgi:putative transcriptional regulator